MKTSEQLRKELYQHIYEMKEKQQKLYSKIVPKGKIKKTIT